MIDFAIIAMPRSGTAWASNWLTTDKTVCIHDPLANWSLEQMGNANSPGLGFACTALWLHPDFVYHNIKRWVILDKDPKAVNEYAAQAGYPPLQDWAINQFFQMRGPRMDHKVLFDPIAARDVWEYLIQDIPFNPVRHELLTNLIVTSRACNV